MGKKIAQLPAGGAAVGTELIEASRDNVSVKLTSQAIADLGGGGAVLTNTFFGVDAGSTPEDNSITTFGNNAGAGNTQGFLTAVGVNAGFNNTGSDTTVYGERSGHSNTGIGLVAIGEEAASDNTGSSVTAIGYQAALTNSGDESVFIGQEVANTNTGNNVTIIGRLAAPTNTFDNVTVLGHSASAGASNTAQIGNASVLSGRFGAPTTVASLPAAADVGAGARAFVTDSNATLAAGLGNIVADGGANLVPVYSDNTNWRIG